MKYLLKNNWLKSKADAIGTSPTQLELSVSSLDYFSIFNEHLSEIGYLRRALCLSSF